MPRKNNFLSRFNPSGTRIDDTIRPTLYLADIEGMMPTTAVLLRSRLSGGILPIFRTKKKQLIRFWEDRYSSTIYATHAGKEVGFIAPLSETELDLSVAKEYQRLGIGTHLTLLYLERHPYAVSGGLTIAGEKTAKRAARYLRKK
jgi:ribosomal protein S18 acetylase RimI-like enzyme